jgi:hypothetical protein
MPELLVIPSELERAAGRLQASADQVRSVVGTLLPTVGVLADDLTGAAGRLQAAAAEYRTTDRSAVPPTDVHAR